MAHGPRVNRPTKIWNASLLLLLVCFVLCALRAHGGDVTSHLELLGNPFLARYSAAVNSRNVNRMRTFNNGVYLGNGSTGAQVPADLWYFDLAQDSFVKEAAIFEETTEQMRVFGDRMYAIRWARAISIAGTPPTSGNSRAMGSNLQGVLPKGLTQSVPYLNSLSLLLSPSHWPMINIHSYHNTNGLDFGCSEAEAVAHFGKPTKQRNNREDEQELHYQGFILRFEASSGKFRECTLLPGCEASINGTLVVWDVGFLHCLGSKDSNLKEVLGFILGDDMVDVVLGRIDQGDAMGLEQIVCFDRISSDLQREVESLQPLVRSFDLRLFSVRFGFRF